MSVRNPWVIQAALFPPVSVDAVSAIIIGFEVTPPRYHTRFRIIGRSSSMVSSRARPRCTHRALPNRRSVPGIKVRKRCIAIVDVW